MPAFNYQVIDTQGKKQSGEIDAENGDAVTRQLRSQGLTVVQVNEGNLKAANKDIKIPGIGGKVKTREITIFSRQFATMVDAGLSILRAIMILEEQTESQAFKDVLQEVASDIEQGRSLSDALKRHPKIFDDLYISMVEAGEIGGVLDMTLRRIADQLEARDSLKRKVKSAMAYPVVVLIFAILATIGMILFLVPIFAQMYKDLDSELPAITQFLVNLSEVGKKHPYIFLLIAVPYIVFKQWKATATGKRQWDRILIRFPMKIGPIVQKIALARFSRTMSSLISSGVPMMAAVEITGKSSGSTIIMDATEDIVSSIEEGRSFSEPLTRHDVFPSMVYQMSVIGEETGKLDTMMEKVAEFYEEEVEAAIKGLTSVIEPLMMILVGGIVGFVIIALYMPMFSLFDKIQ